MDECNQEKDTEDGLVQSDSQHDLQQETMKKQDTALLEGTGPTIVQKLGSFLNRKDENKKEVQLQQALAKIKNLERECAKLSEKKDKLKEKQSKKEEELKVALAKIENLYKEQDKRKDQENEKEVKLQVALTKIESLEKECKDLSEKLKKLTEKQRELKEQKMKLTLENAIFKEAKEVFKKEMKEEERNGREQENQLQYVEHEMLLTQLKDLKKSEEEREAKIKELKRNQKDLMAQKNQLKEKIRQSDAEKKQNETREAELLDIQRKLESLSQSQKTVAVKREEILKLHDNVDQVKSMYQKRIEELRSEMTQRTSEESLKEIFRQVNKNSSAVASDRPVLLQKIQPFFVFCVDPLNVLYIINAYDPKVLIQQDIQEVQCATQNHGSIRGASELLNRLARYEGWLSCLLNVLRDSKVQQNHVADKIEEVLENLDADEKDELTTTEVKKFREERKEHTTQMVKLQTSIKSLQDMMRDKDAQHEQEIQAKSELHKVKTEKLNAEIHELTKQIEDMMKRDEKQKKIIEAKNELHKDEKEKLKAQIDKLTKRIKGQELLPYNWDPMDDSETLKLVTLQPGTLEYNSVFQNFRRTASQNKVRQIDRIQNKTLYQRYAVTKREIDQRNPKNHQNEHKLFHGTDAETVTLINENGFNRSFCARHIYESKDYGLGLYFALNASYSVKYAKPDGTGLCRMFQARVLVGETTESDENIIFLPLKKGGDHPYDSATDDLNNVENRDMYIVFCDNQAYPEYLITFT